MLGSLSIELNLRSITLSILNLCVGTCLSFLKMLYSSILHETNLWYSNDIIGCLCLLKFLWICMLKFASGLVLFFLCLFFLFQYTDKEVERCYEEFYEDVHSEFQKYGEIANFKVTYHYF